MIKKIGITGSNGFIGNHLKNNLRLHTEKYTIINFERNFFSNENKLDEFVNSCDFIVHLAAINRSDSEDFLYKKNINLIDKLIESLDRTKSKPNIILTSSTQENQNNLYGKSKKEGRLKLEKFCNSNEIKFNGLIVPNVFGSFGKPYYNSVVATFCYQLTNNLEPKIDNNSEIKLIYIDKLIQFLIEIIDNNLNQKSILIEFQKEIYVNKILDKLKSFKEVYFDKGEMPLLESDFELDLFNTFRSFIDFKNYFPKKYIQNKDKRGEFVELIRSEIGGQMSFSTTKSKVVRGNHYHTRKIERFSVIKGTAEIKIRKINSDEIISYIVSGENPSYIDMPIWYTHNIKNIGKEDLFTNFWINEPFNPDSPDTYMEIV